MHVHMMYIHVMRHTLRSPPYWLQLDCNAVQTTCFNDRQQVHTVCYMMNIGVLHISHNTYEHAKTQTVATV